MGEIIFSIFVGGWMVAAGVFLIKWLTREEKRTARMSAEKRGDNL